MEKEYEAFAEELRQDLLRATGYEESRIYFKKKEDYPQTSGDRILWNAGSVRSPGRFADYMSGNFMRIILTEKQCRKL